MKIIKITEGFVTNSSSYSGSMLIAVRKGKDLRSLLRKIGIPREFASRFGDIRFPEAYKRNRINFEDLTSRYKILEAWVLLAAYGDSQANGAPPGGEDNELRQFIEDHNKTMKRIKLVNDELILLNSECHY